MSTPADPVALARDLLRCASWPLHRSSSQSQLLRSLDRAPVVLPAVIFIRDNAAISIGRDANFSQVRRSIVIPSVLVPSHELDANRFAGGLR